ncbi:hypothetical protein DFH08DRAFT_822043 [Mycena albidolilacea]|uniref:Uncharacterized protein n=1 Tax=Mycena albidolilacea TaxID=1033008 RepID=A0AAD6ZA58_9AGAR|nr:hypothetical protein DFH08DRAFT_822043 [Mycena albidolilacea]
MPSTLWCRACMSICTQIFLAAAGDKAGAGDGRAPQCGLVFEASALEGGEGCRWNADTHSACSSVQEANAQSWCRAHRMQIGRSSLAATMRAGLGWGRLMGEVMVVLVGCIWRNGVNIQTQKYLDLTNRETSIRKMNAASSMSPARAKAKPRMDAMKGSSSMEHVILTIGESWRKGWRRVHIWASEIQSSTVMTCIQICLTSEVECEKQRGKMHSGASRWSGEARTQTSATSPRSKDDAQAPHQRARTVGGRVHMKLEKNQPQGSTREKPSKTKLLGEVQAKTGRKRRKFKMS